MRCGEQWFPVKSHKSLLRNIRVLARVSGKDEWTRNKHASRHFVYEFFNRGVPDANLYPPLAATVQGTAVCFSQFQ